MLSLPFRVLILKRFLYYFQWEKKTPRSHISTASNHCNKLSSQSWGDARVRRAAKPGSPKYLWQLPDPQQVLLVPPQLSVCSHER